MHIYSRQKIRIESARELEVPVAEPVRRQLLGLYIPRFVIVVGVTIIRFVRV
jgi:hypothetical protein